jgi:hypothetical protein
VIGFPSWWVHQGTPGIKGEAQGFLFFQMWDTKVGQNPSSDSSLLTPWGASTDLPAIEGYTLRQSWLNAKPNLYTFIGEEIEAMDKKIRAATTSQTSTPKKKTSKKKTVGKKVGGK